LSSFHTVYKQLMWKMDLHNLLIFMKLCMMKKRPCW